MLQIKLTVATVGDNASIQIAPDESSEYQPIGQDDDITVLTFTRLAVVEESTAQLATPMLFPLPA
jgi:hypothetical protein